MKFAFLHYLLVIMMLIVVFLGGVFQYCDFFSFFCPSRFLTVNLYQLPLSAQTVGHHKIARLCTVLHILPTALLYVDVSNEVRIAALFTGDNYVDSGVLRRCVSVL